MFVKLRLLKEDGKETKGDWAVCPLLYLCRVIQQREWQTDNLSFFNLLNFNNYGFRVCSNKKSVRF